MNIFRPLLGIGVVLLGLAACNSGGSSTGPASTVPAVSASSGLQSARNSTCVPAQATPQSVTLPTTGGVTASFTFSKYDAGGTGCQNLVIATGASAATIGDSSTPAPEATTADPIAASALLRQTQTDAAPLISIIAGEGYPSSLGLVTAASGMQLATDPNLNFPDGVYNATVTSNVLGTPITISLQFTASGGVLRLTSANALPLFLRGGATINIYDRGVVPSGFTLAVPAATANAAATPVPVPAASADPSIFGNPPPTDMSIGTQSYQVAGCAMTAFQDSGYPCYNPQPLLVNGSGNYALFYTPGGVAGSVTYNVSGFSALSYELVGCLPPMEYSGGGLSGTFTFPDRSAFPTGQSTYCAIRLSSAPPGYQGSAYGVTLLLYDTGGLEPDPSMSLPTVQPTAVPK